MRTASKAIRQLDRGFETHFVPPLQTAFYQEQTIPIRGPGMGAVGRVLCEVYPVINHSMRNRRFGVDPFPPIGKLTLIDDVRRQACADGVQQPVAVLHRGGGAADRFCVSDGASSSRSTVG